jgi:RNAse (barnase) inhibitor barstar
VTAVPILFLTLLPKEDRDHGVADHPTQHRAGDQGLPGRRPDAGGRAPPASISCTPTCPARRPSRRCWTAIAAAFTFPAHFGKNLDALYDCMTDLVHKAGQQPGFVVVLEQMPDNPRFDREAREQLLECLPRRRRILGGATNTVQMFLFFSVARSLEIGSWERATEVAQARAAVKPQ